MFFVTHFNQSVNSNLTNKCRIVAIILLSCCFIAEAGFGYDIPDVTSVYVFIQDQSSLNQSGGLGDISESYSIKGRFTFYADYHYDEAYFEDSNAIIVEESSYLSTYDLDEIFNFYDLESTFIDKTTVKLTGTTNDGTDSDIVLTLSFVEDLVYLDGQITPPSSEDYTYQLTAVARRKYGGGDGSSYNPYLINTAEHMNTIGLNPGDWSSNFNLTNNIDISAYRNKDYNIIGYYNSEADNKPFSGTFYGKGKYIRNFTYKTSVNNRIGLFGYVKGEFAKISYLSITDPNISASGGEYIGALVGHLASGTITNCNVIDGAVTGTDKVGGLVGRSGVNTPVTNIEDQPCEAGMILYCLSTASVTGTYQIGGLVGSNDGAITNCNSTGDVTGESQIGGLAGFNDGIILASHTAGSVYGIRRVGALVGNNYGIICAGNTEGTVIGKENVGGIAGFNSGGHIKYSYSTGIVDGNSIVGGLAGSNGGNISSSYSLASVTGDLYIGGCTGKNFWSISSCYSAADVNVQYGYAGGISGTNETNGNISNCYSIGTVAGRIYTGGLLGRNDGIVMKCYSTGLVTDNYDDEISIGFGGLIGDSNDMSTAFLSFWDTQTSGMTTSAGGTGKTTAQMQEKATYDNWGKCSGEINWTIYQGEEPEDANKDYPRLLWENEPGGVIETVKITDLLTGSGTEDDPFLIFTPEELNEIGLFPCEWDKQFLLMDDIDMSGFASQNFNVIGFYRMPFIGVFDGNNHVISNLTFNSKEQSYVGLFGCIGSLIAQIKDLGLIDPVLEANRNIGSLAGCLKEGAITNCYAQNVDVNGYSSVAGLVGDNRAAIMNCYSTGNVNGYTNIGGLVGNNCKGAIEGCSSNSVVSGDSDVGGLIGNNSGYITTSSSNSSVSGTASAGGFAGSNLGTIENVNSSGHTSGFEKIGGLIGNNAGSLTNCNSTANVNGDLNTGGLAGLNMDAAITNCNATGNVYGRLWTGGLTGQNSGQSSISDCYSTSYVSGYELIGGLVGKNESLISQSYSTGIVSGTTEIGGLVGWNFSPGTITNSYSQGSVLATQWAGGLVGINSGSINKCYSSGSVGRSTMTAGGLASFNFGTVSASFWDIETSGQTASAAGIGKTTADMKKKSTFTSAGWDFTGIWKISEGQDYPELSWQQ